MTDKELAILENRKTYKSSTTCKHGHESPMRYVCNNRCVDCQKKSGSSPEAKQRKTEWSREYNSQPEVKKKSAERRALRSLDPSAREARRAYEKERYSDPVERENRNAYLRERNKRPDVQQKRKEHKNRPEVKQRARELEKIGVRAEKIKKSRKEYRQKNKAKLLSDTRCRQLRLRQGNLSQLFKKDLDEIYRTRDRVSTETGVAHHADHMIPLNNPIVCGLHVPWNMRVITAEENLRKGNKLDLDLLKELGYDIS